MLTRMVGYSAVQSATVLVGWLVCTTGIAAAPAPPEEMVLVQRVIDTRYEENYGGSRTYPALLHSSLRRLHTVKPNESLQSITNSLFAIGPKAAPRAYRALETFIVDTNHLKSQNDLHAGQKLVLPDLAPKQVFNEVGTNPLSNQPKVSPSPRLSEVSTGEAFSFSSDAFTAIPKVTDIARKSAAFVTQWRWIPASQAEKEVAVADTLGAAPTTVQSGAVSVQFVDDQHGVTGPDEIADDVAFLRSLLARKQPTREMVVYVLDDSWPTQIAFAGCRDFFAHAAQVVNRRFALGGSEWPPAMLSPNAKVDFPFATRSVSPHAAKVDAALEPLAKLSDKVRIVYVPLFSEQAWSKEFLHELLRLAFTARGKGEGLDDGSAPAPDVIKTARTLADDIAPKLPSQLVNDVAQTDQSVIASLFLFAQLYARATGTPFYISMSWTVPKYRFAIAPEPDTFGVPLAAVGNNIGYDVMENKVLLSMRAREYPGDVLAIMNAHSDGRVDCSSEWVVPPNEVVYGFVYDGFLIGGACGTSFSTPRVAWLLALREGFNAPVGESSQGTWFIEYRRFLLELQDATAQGYRRYWLSPKRLFQGL
jgi:hypothetical protein